MPRWATIGIVMAAAAISAGLILRLAAPDDHGQVQAVLEDATRHLQDGDAAALMDLLDPGFDLHAALGADPAEDSDLLRRQVKADLASALFVLKARGTPPLPVWAITAVDGDDQTVRASVTASAASNGLTIPETAFTMRLVRHGWLRPSLRLLAIEPSPFTGFPELP